MIVFAPLEPRIVIAVLVALAFTLVKFVTLVVPDTWLVLARFTFALASR